MYFGPPVTGAGKGKLTLYFRNSIKVCGNSKIFDFIKNVFQVTTEFQRYTSLSLIAEIGSQLNKPKGLKVAKDIQTADRLDGR